jgi:hypothetical protein
MDEHTMPFTAGPTTVGAGSGSSAHVGEGLRLYAWQPKGHGELSWFVVAATEAEAKNAVDREIARRRALPWDDPEHIGASEVEGWGSDYYTLTVAERGRPVDNANE